jgi:hypothetical protein
MTNEEALKRIEEKHWSREGKDRGYCTICGGPSPCDVVKLARALVELWKGCQYDPEYPYDEGGPSLRVLQQAERTLRKVAGEEEG